MKQNLTSVLTLDAFKRKHFVLLGLFAMAPLTLACYGRFPLTRAVYNFNGNVSHDRFAQSIVFWLFIIIPVYGVASFVDAIALNLVQFWTGDTVELSEGVDANGNHVALAPAADGQSATLTVSREGRTLYQGRFVRNGADQWLIQGPNGERQGTVDLTGDGGVEIHDAEGRMVKRIPASTVNRAHAEAEGMRSFLTTPAGEAATQAAPVASHPKVISPSLVY